MRKETRRYQANFALSWAATCGGTKAETSPPMPAIWRTKVAVIGRTMGEAGRNTVCTSGAMAPFMPACCGHCQIVEGHRFEHAARLGRQRPADVMEHLQPLLG